MIIRTTAHRKATNQGCEKTLCLGAPRFASLRLVFLLFCLSSRIQWTLKRIAVTSKAPNTIPINHGWVTTKTTQFHVLVTTSVGSWFKKLNNTIYCFEFFQITYHSLLICQLISSFNICCSVFKLENGLTSHMSCTQFFVPISMQVFGWNILRNCYLN